MAALEAHPGQTPMSGGCTGAMKAAKELGWSFVL